MEERKTMDADRTTVVVKTGSHAQEKKGTFEEKREREGGAGTRAAGNRR